MKIKLTSDQLDLLKMGTVMCTENKKFYYFPFWIKETEGVEGFELLSPEYLDPDLINILLKNRAR